MRFSPAAWAKLHYFCHRGPTEIGGFAITDPDDLLYVVDFQTVKQKVSSVTVDFDDTAVADFFEDQVDFGNQPEQFARIWLHTHPGFSPNPSGVDEDTFNRVFGNCDWSVMFILAKDGKAFARLHFSAGPGGDMSLPVEVDFEQGFAGSDHAAWEDEYQENIDIGFELPSTASTAGIPVTATEYTNKDDAEARMWKRLDKERQEEQEWFDLLEADTEYAHGR